MMAAGKPLTEEQVLRRRRAPTGQLMENRYGRNTPMVVAPGTGGAWN